LKQQLQTSELKNLRLEEAFKSTSQKFRSMVYRLLGYQITLKGDRSYQLMSMYAETPEDFIFFKV
jgi:mitotic spindle assembly checkpoint protein MAD1